MALPRGHAPSTRAPWYSISFATIISFQGSRPANKLLMEHVVRA